MQEEKTEKKKFNLKNLFFNEEQVETVVTEKKQQPTQPLNVPQQQTVVPVTGVVGVINKEMYDTLMNVIEEQNFPGPDYLELKRAADSMSSVIPDENTRYISAYTVLKSSNNNFNKTVILNSIDKYIQFIENEKTDAQNQLSQIYQNEIGSRQNEIEKRVKLIEENKKKIEELNAQIMSASQEINTINGEMLTKKTELEIQEKNFNVTVESIINGLNNDKNKLNTIIVE